jgi:hypothetical protein
VLKFFNLINESGTDYIPDVYDMFQPLKKKYSPNCLQDVINLWLNKEYNASNVNDGYKAGHILLEKKKGSKVSYHINWNKDNEISMFNLFVLSVDIDYLKKENNLIEYLALCKKLICIFKPVYAEIVNINFPGWETPINLRIRLPEPRWQIIFGEPYVKIFTEEKLLGAPCYKVEKVNDMIILQLSESVFEAVPEETISKVKKYLGEDAFVWDNKSVWSYKDGLTPKFDFSEILFDKNAPIKETELIKKKTE